MLCVRNDGCDDIEPRKVYQVLPDPEAARSNYLRVVYDSGEDYLYPADYFVPIGFDVQVAAEWGREDAAGS